MRSCYRYDQHKQMQEYVKKLNSMYREYPALYAEDNDLEGFESINNISANENVIVFLRKTAKDKDTPLVVCNFANEKRKQITRSVFRIRANIRKF